MKSSQANRLIVFDFDGTLIDSLNVHYEAMRNALKDLIGYDLTKKEYLLAFEINPWKYWITKFKISKWKVPYLVWRVKRHTLGYYHRAKFFSRIKETIRNLSKKHTLVVVTSTPEASIIKRLKEENLDKCFSAILGAKAGLSKETKFKKLQKKYDKEIIFITDTLGDIKEAKKCGLKTGAVGWGWHSLSKLKKAKPDYIFRKPQDILKAL